MDYPSTVLADSPIADWKLADSSGTTAADSSGNGYDATYSGSGVTLGQAGIPGDLADTAALLDGASGTYVAAPSDPAFALVDAVTAEAWIKITGTPSGYVMFQWNGLTDLFEGWAIYINSGVPHATISRGTGASKDTNSGSALAAGWHHIGLTYDRATLRLYVDGAEASSIAATQELLCVGGPAIGQSNNAIFRFPLAATFAQCAVYDHALSAGRMAVHHAVGMGEVSGPSLGQLSILQYGGTPTEAGDGSAGSNAGQLSILQYGGTPR